MANTPLLVILGVIVIFFIKASAAYLGSLTLHLENNTFKTASKYSLSILISALIGFGLSYLSLTYVPVVFFIVILAWIYFVLWILARFYEMNVLEALGTVVIFKLMELGIVLLLATIVFAVSISFGVRTTGNLNDAIDNLNTLNSQLDSLQSLDQESLLNLPR